MPATSVQQFEQLNFEGPFGLAVALLLGLGCAILFARWLQREAQIIGWRKSVFFWLLRTTALGCVLWMLLAPTQVQTSTATTRRAVIVVQDHSGSMGTVDPIGSADDLRWQLATQRSVSNSPLVLVDQLGVAWRKADQHLQITEGLLQQVSDTDSMATAIDAADQTCTRARTLLQELSDQENLSPVVSSLIDRLQERLAGPEFQELSRVAAVYQKGRMPADTSWREGISDLLFRLQSGQTLLRQLEEALADSRSVDSPLESASALQQTRFERVQAVMQALRQQEFARLVEQVDLHVFDLGDKITSSQVTEPQAAGDIGKPSESTNLTALIDTLHREFAEQPVAGVFLFSDFSHNQPDVADPAQLAQTLKNIPIYTIPVGNPRPIRDLELQSVFAPAVAMRNDDIVIEARIQAHDCAGEVCTVQLLRDGVEISRREIPLDADYISRTVRFEEHVSLVGVQSYRVHLLPLAKEATDQNNTRDLEVNVTRNDLKLLIADEYPRWEYRYLTQLFRRDAQIICEELLFHPRQVATGQREITRTLPVTADDWDYYDLVILGDLPTEHFPVSSQESLVEYLQQRGGTVVLIAGPQAMPVNYERQPLAEILPVLPVDDSSPDGLQDYELQVTQAGRDHPALMIADTFEESRVAWDFINRYSPLPQVSSWRKPRPTAHSLLAAVPRHERNQDAALEHSSFLCWQPIGRGRVMYLAGPESYRLRLLRGDRLHYRFWGQLLRWAMASDLGVGSQFIRIRTDKTRYLSRDKVEITAQIHDLDGQPLVSNDLVAVLTTEDSPRHLPLIPNPQVPGEYHASTTGLAPGDYQLSVSGELLGRINSQTETGSVTTTIVVQPERSMELIDTRCQRVLAEELARATGGQMIPPTAIPEVLNLTSLEPLTSTTVARQPLWVQWKYLWIVFGCLQTEWIIRKWLGVS